MSVQNNPSQNDIVPMDSQGSLDKKNREPIVKSMSISLHNYEVDNFKEPDLKDLEI